MLLDDGEDDDYDGDGDYTTLLTSNSTPDYGEDNDYHGDGDH